MKKPLSLQIAKTIWLITAVGFPIALCVYEISFIMFALSLVQCFIISRYASYLDYERDGYFMTEKSSVPPAVVFTNYLAAGLVILLLGGVLSTGGSPMASGQKYYIVSHGEIVKEITYQKYIFHRVLENAALWAASLSCSSAKYARELNRYKWKI